MMIFLIPWCRGLVFSNAFLWSFPWSYQEAVGCHRAGTEPVRGSGGKSGFELINFVWCSC